MPDKLLGNFRHPWLTGIPVYSVPACPFLMDKKKHTLHRRRESDYLQVKY